MIWICPVYQSPMVDHGYDISDYTKIDPMFGSKEDLERLIREAEKRGITVLMDLVINHTSDQHPWFQEALDKINATSREHSRTPMQWSSGKWAGFSEVKPWFDVNPDYVSCNLEAQRAPGSLREFFRKVTALRRDGRYEKTWIYGSFCPKEQESGQIWGFVRRRDTQELAVMVNFTDQPARTGQIYRVRQILLNNYGESEAGVQREEDGRLLLQPWQALVMELKAD